MPCSCGKRVGSKFKEVYPSTSVVMSSKKKSKETGKKSQNSQKAYANFLLSPYAAHLTKEFVVKVLALNLKNPILGKWYFNGLDNVLVIKFSPLIGKYILHYFVVNCQGIYVQKTKQNLGSQLIQNM